jgi:hypothetical protein
LTRQINDPTSFSSEISEKDIFNGATRNHEEETLSVFEIVGSPLRRVRRRPKVYERIASAFGEDRSVTVSFLNVSGVTSAF